MSQDYRPAGHQREAARETEPHEAEEGEQGDAGDDPGQDEREEHQPAERRLAGEIEAVEHEGPGYADQ